MRHKTSVLIVNSKDKVSKIHQVPTHLIVHWQKYILTFSMVIVTLIIVSGFLIFQRISRSYQERLQRANYIQSQIDIQRAKSAFSSIDSSMYRINHFLEERGLEALKMENVGGPGLDFDITFINQAADYYNSQIIGLEKTLENLPLGIPYEGKITSGFGYRHDPFSLVSSEFHGGIDIKGPEGDSIQCTGSGTVILAGLQAGYGNCIIVEHNKNLQTVYAHLSKINVAKGDKVQSGQNIGQIGCTGRTSGPHLHYEILLNGQRIDPQKYIHFGTEEKES